MGTATMVRIFHMALRETYGMSLSDQTTLKTLQEQVECRSGVSVADQRLVCNGRQLDDANKTLEDMNIQTKAIIYLLDKPKDACWAWCATGACPEGSRCKWSASHKIDLSPRYVEHLCNQISCEIEQAPQSSAPGSQALQIRDADAPWLNETGFECDRTGNHEVQQYEMAPNYGNLQQAPDLQRPRQYRKLQQQQPRQMPHYGNLHPRQQCQQPQQPQYVTLQQHQQQQQHMCANLRHQHQQQGNYGNLQVPFEEVQRRQQAAMQHMQAQFQRHEEFNVPVYKPQAPPGHSGEF